MTKGYVETEGACLRVQFGCGWSAPRGWRNFDASPVLRFERIPLIGRLWTKNSTRFPKNVEYGDIVKGLPVAADSCESVYCSHVLEHLCLADCRTALRNVCRILSPGGIFRLVLPDLRFCIEEYAASSSQDAALTFLRRSGLGQEQPARGLRQFLVLWLGNSSHLWLWDYESMAAELTDAGFCDIRRAAFHDSQESCFADVEDQERWQDCLGIECRRPCVA